MRNVIQQVYDFNKSAGLLDKGYDDFLESSFQIEEALEGMDITKLAESSSYLSSCAAIDGYTPKNLSRAIVQSALPVEPLSDVDRLDKACDAVVFAIGSMAKLGLTPDQINQALEIVATSVQAKVNCPKDEHGKLTKPANWEDFTPEPKLQALLDNRAPDAMSIHDALVYTLATYKPVYCPKLDLTIYKVMSKEEICVHLDKNNTETLGGLVPTSYYLDWGNLETYPSQNYFTGEDLTSLLKNLGALVWVPKNP